VSHEELYFFDRPDVCERERCKSVAHIMETEALHSDKFRNLGELFAKRVRRASISRVRAVLEF